DEVRHETVRPASRTSRAARATPTASSFRTDTPIPGAPAAANASTSRSNDQPRVVISLIEKRTTKEAIPAAGRERQGAWPEVRPLGYPRPRADRGQRPAPRRRRTHRPTLAPRPARAPGGRAGRLAPPWRTLPGARAA